MKVKIILFLNTKPTLLQLKQFIITNKIPILKKNMTTKQKIIECLITKYKIPNNRIVYYKQKHEIFSHKEQGRREYMEDNIFCFSNNFISFSAIYDGHGGNECSVFLRNYLFSLFKKNIAKTEQIKKSIKNAFKEADQKFLSLYSDSGSTANTLIINKKTNTYLVANVGDSRAIAYYNTNKVKQLSYDHKPNKKEERTKIMRRGGFVSADNRVNGTLAMSRAFGDKRLKKYIDANPDLQEGSLKNIKYIVQASDGLYDVMSNKEICIFINNLLDKNISKDKIPKILVNYAIDVKNSYDNTTVIITYI
jgi:protein phosphatase 1L